MPYIKKGDWCPKCVRPTRECTCDNIHGQLNRSVGTKPCKECGYIYSLFDLTVHGHCYGCAPYFDTLTGMSFEGMKRLYNDWYGRSNDMIVNSIHSAHRIARMLAVLLLLTVTVGCAASKDLQNLQQIYQAEFSDRLAGTMDIETEATDPPKPGR